MKLYTEEQLRKAIRRGYCSAICEDRTITEIADNFLKSITPIELPSDEEIEEYFKHGWGSDNHGSYAIFVAKWLKDKIQGGNK